MRNLSVFLRSCVALGGCALLLSACQRTMTPVVPAGSAAYDALALPEGQPQTYLLRTGDVVTVSVYGEPELTRDKILIDDNGTLNLPLIGEVQAAGRSASDLAAEIEAAYGAQYVRNPSVTVSINEARKLTVSVEGEVNMPGVYAIEPGQTLLTAVALARSPTKTAKLDEVLVFRQVNGQRMGARFDLVQIRSGIDPDPQLLPGDVIVVGFSRVQGAYRDILQAAPLLNVFAQF